MGRGGKVWVPPTPKGLDFLPDHLISPDREGQGWSRQCILTSPQDQLKLKTLRGEVGGRAGFWVRGLGIGKPWLPNVPSVHQEGHSSTHSTCVTFLPIHWHWGHKG